MESDSHTANGSNSWRVLSTQMVAIVGIVDVLQFWTPAKRIAQAIKRTVGMERDGGRDHCGEVIDTVWPENYAARFLRFLRELFTQGSWVDSLAHMSGGDWLSVLTVQIEQLPEPQRRQAEALYHRAEELEWAQSSWFGPEDASAMMEFQDELEERVPLPLS